MMMRKLLKYILFLFVLPALSLSSCTQQHTNDDILITTDSIKSESIIPLNNDTNSAACRVSMLFTYIAETNHNVIKDSVNQTLLRELLGSAYENMDPVQAVDSFKTGYINRYRQEMAELLKIGNDFSIDEHSGVLNYSKILKCRMVYKALGILTFRADTYEYTGGAHGMSNSFLFNFDLSNGKRFTLADIFAPQYEERLNDLLIKQLMKDNKVNSEKELEDLGYFITSPIFPSENFYFDKEDIIFLYNPYEIAPYSMGSTEISIPFEELSFLLKEKSPIQNLID